MYVNKGYSKDVLNIFVDLQSYEPSSFKDDRICQESNLGHMRLAKMAIFFQTSKFEAS